MKYLNAQPHPHYPLSTIRYPLQRSGFSFAEVMFAVVILGIGFIMIAAIFPVAIQQTQANGEENIAAIAARDVADSMTQIPSTVMNPVYYANPTATELAQYGPAVNVVTYPAFPPTVKNYVLGSNPSSSAPPAIVVPFNGTRWKMLQSDTIMISDQRYAYVPFYKRENGAGAAELIVVAVAVRNKPTYVTLNDALNSQPTATVTTVSHLNLSTPPSQSGTTVIYPDTISVTGASGSNIPGEGSAVIGPTPIAGAFSGRTYTLGRFLGSSQWEINPGDGLALTAGSNGNWGTPGATIDALLNGTKCTYNTSTTLQAQVAYVQMSSTPQNPAGQIKIFSSQSNFAVPLNVGTGAFVIIADDYPFNPAPAVAAPAYDLPANAAGVPNGPPPFTVGSMNGRIFRLGSLVGPDGNGIVSYNLDPAYGMLPAGQYSVSPDTLPNPQTPSIASYGETSLWGAKCYIVGVGQVNGAYSGPTQDTGVFATYFSVK